MITISTHVLDTTLGTPAAKIPVVLYRVSADGDALELASGETNMDGRVPVLAPAGDLVGGDYRLCFDVAGHFGGRESFYSTICIDFIVADTSQHYHVPLLLSPFGYATYRGS